MAVIDSGAKVLNVTKLEYAWKKGDVPVLRIDALGLAKGERVFLRGPSGSGKSTLLAAIAGVVDIPTGSISVAGTDVGQLRGGARDRFRVNHIGLIFQMFNLIPWQSALENVLMPCRFSRRRRERAGADPKLSALRLLDELGLSDPALVSAPAMSLSVGQQQRVAAARALIGAPELILADEPTSALDEGAKASFLDLLKRECESVGSALLFVSHDRSLERGFDRVLEITEVNKAW
ncbi:ATP-binding cassette domain-containing protein [Tropicimonas sediminicola]|uniref:Putative ABC transport system ATP-binding protein n=1 Tax=Tropicimonas sediminicola TaxID=1031541 RepID=A0A239DEM5_9RHOB|nr:ATP-binding cassette domain-containing protein [Tropicimonas sediminicola]SNS30800.1 putative ABC transport system ATP-binding protein [Tropicimonas sediminicola]